MRIEAAIRRSRRLSLTSLIDVIFLLLLFFMLTSTFSRFAEVPIGAAGEAGAGSSLPDIVMTLTTDEMAVNGQPVTLSSLPAELSRLKDAGARSASIYVREGSTSQALVDVLERFRDVGIAAALAR